MMQTCEEHDGCVVVFTSEECPFCKTQETVEEMREEIEGLKEELQDAKGEIQDLEKIAEEETVGNN